MRITLSTLQRMSLDGNKIATLTCYDASFAALLDAAGVEVMLVGDSLGMVLQGHETTLPVTLEQMVYHTACVARGAKRALVMADMPFGTFQIGPADTFRNAAQLIAAGRADGEDRRRRADVRDGRVPDATRDSRLRPRRAHAAVGAPVRRLPRAGPRAKRRPRAFWTKRATSRRSAPG